MRRLYFGAGRGLRLCFFVSFIFSSEVLLVVAPPIAKEGKKDTSRRWTARHEATRKKSFTFFKTSIYTLNTFGRVVWYPTIIYYYIRIRSRRGKHGQDRGWREGFWVSWVIMDLAYCLSIKRQRRDF
ncbi:hypothetical protein P167DRAFT_146227 [Morchella conica CCBAS932]|uniref:Uncharacterized protein n=1 Tax=Morchella conica CCBAS932 TaxID=1392247 RepID=A0A3N4KU97_9PEZI|nr:hypothetical protein P167DRAFT_146227 [Morchella conica CCBAS932]